MNRPAKVTMSATPSHGWMMRVQTPPPNRLVRKNSAGWNSAIPLRASRMRMIALSQWFALAPGV
jgi:hypothetical protein